MALIPKATDRVSWRGVVTDRRTASALNKAEKEWRRRVNSKAVTLSPSQGSFSTSVSASGNTHAGAGVLDLRTGAYSQNQIRALVHTLRDYGFAAWYRTAADGFAPHIHLVALPVKGKANGLSPAALWQTVAYDAGRSGLSGNKMDRDSYRPRPRVRWSWLQRKAVPR
jgi:hypothetical protein